MCVHAQEYTYCFKSSALNSNVRYPIVALKFTTMPVGYSVDLRWRAIWLHFICGKKRLEVADLLVMSKKSVDRYISLYQSTGTVEPKKQRHGPQHVLSEFEQISLLQSLVNKPTMYLKELQSANRYVGTPVDYLPYGTQTPSWID